MSGFASVALEDVVNGVKARIGRDGAAHAAPGAAEADNGAMGVTTSYSEIAAENEDRRQIQIQNQSSTVPVFIRLDGNSIATPGYRIDPGGTYSFPPGVTYRGTILGKANPSAEIVILEFTEPV